MGELKNKRRLKFLLGLIILLLALGINTKVFAKNYSIENVDIQATLRQDGNLEIKQKMEYKFEGSYNGVYINIPYILNDEEYDKFRTQTSVLKDSYYNGKGVVIQGVTEGGKAYKKASYASNGNSGVFTETIEDEILQVKIYSPSSNTSKTFTVSYIIQNLAVKHNDIGEIYYNFIGGAWERTIKNLNIDIYLPNNTDRENLYLYAHGPYNGECKIVSSTHVNLKVTNVQPGKYVAARVLFNLDNIPNSTKASNIDAKNIIFQDEEKIAENIEGKKSLTAKITIFGAVLLVYWLVLILIYEKDKRRDVYNINEDELFEKYNPLIAGCIQGSREVLARDIIAVILNLVNKKVIKLEPIHSADLNSYQIKNSEIGKDYKYMISKVKENEDKMDSIERYIYSWVFKGQEKIELAQRLQEMPKEEDSNQQFKRLNERANEELNKIGANKKKVPLILRIVNNLLFVIAIILAFVHIQYNGLQIYSPDLITVRNIQYIYANTSIFPINNVNSLYPNLFDNYGKTPSK